MNDLSHSVEYRDVWRTDEAELRFIANHDSRVPLEYDPEYRVTEKSIQDRIDFYKRAIKPSDFFGAAVFENRVVGFHIVLKRPHPPDLFAGDIVTLWTDPDFRGQGIATELKKRGELWASASGITYLFTGVHPQNAAMLAINKREGFVTDQINLRKKISSN